MNEMPMGQWIETDPKAAREFLLGVQADLDARAATLATLPDSENEADKAKLADLDRRVRKLQKVVRRLLEDANENLAALSE